MSPGTVPEDKFSSLVERHGRPLFIMCQYITEHSSEEKLLVRSLLGELLAHSMQLEELLDAYGARNNRRWRPFRSMIATIKNFSDISYELLHIEHVLPGYHLRPSDRDIEKSTQQTLKFTGDVIISASGQLLEKARELSLKIPEKRLKKKYYDEEYPEGQLAHDHARRRIGTVSKTVTLLATSFLNLAAESDLVHAAAKAKPQEYAEYIPDPVSEESLRALDLRFHNLQSTYDTYVAGTETEDLDEDLPVLRGHISVVLHLLKTATGFAHYYERHIENRRAQLELPVRREILLATLMDYSLAYSSWYIVAGKKLAQEMLKRYAEVGRIDVPVPQYRGFHVRPSTLISKLVQHYGSKVEMELDNDRYDAGSALELFRANEKINAEKRRSLAEEISKLDIICKPDQSQSFRDIVRCVVLSLAEKKKIVIYEQPLQLSEEPGRAADATILEQVIAEITRLLATGKLDVESTMTVSFIGDKRVLEDIKLLAENGYGEDKFGNNIPLPEKLAYLRR